MREDGIASQGPQRTVALEKKKKKKKKLLEQNKEKLDKKTAPLLAGRFKE
jgi:hypothetical protein